MLRESTTDRAVAWHAGDLRLDEFEAQLGADTVVELREHRSFLHCDPASLAAHRPDLQRFPSLARAVDALRKNTLERYGALLIRGASFGALSDLERTNVFWLMLSMLGEPIQQNDEGSRFVIVRDEGQRMAAGGRYHKSNEGGELHTDAPQFEAPPRFVGLQCIRPAAEGGASKLVSAHAIHNALLAEAPELLELLYQPFHFHRQPTSRTVHAPVFSWDPAMRELRVRYLGDYVRSGQRLVGKPLDGTREGEALDALDRLLADEARFAVEFALGAGDVLVLENHRIFHGRSAFRDHDDDRPRREMNRIWVDDRTERDSR